MDQHQFPVLYGMQKNYPKSNILIGAKYKSSLTELKILSICLASMERIKKDNSGVYYQEFSSSELKALFGSKSGNFFTTLDNASKHMTGRTICYRDEENHYFDYISVISRSKFEKGVFRVEYNPAAMPYLSELSKNFTVLNLPITLKFKKSAYSYRLYELLRSRCYPKTKFDACQEFQVPFSVSELKLDLGVINASDDKVQSVLQRSSHPDYDKAVEVSSAKVLQRWSQFKEKAIDPAVKEINDISDLEVSYETHGAGRGGKIQDITFFVRKKDGYDYESNSVQKLQNIDQDEVLEEFMDLSGLRLRDAKAVCVAAQYDLHKLRLAWNFAESYGSEIDNLPGFLIDAIKKGYKKNSYATDEEVPYSFSDEIKITMA